MAESSSSGLHRMMDSIGKCEGYKSFRQWRTRIREAIILYSLLPVLDGDARPLGHASTADAVAVWEKANGRLYSLLFFATSGSAQLTVRAHEGRGTRLMGDGLRHGTPSTSVSTPKTKKVGVLVTMSCST